MATSCDKEKVERLVRSLPPDATIEDAMERLYLLFKIEKGLSQADAGEGFSQEEARRRLQKWLA